MEHKKRQSQLQVPVDVQVNNQLSSGSGAMKDALASVAAVRAIGVDAAAAGTSSANK